MKRPNNPQRGDKFKVVRAHNSLGRYSSGDIVTYIDSLSRYYYPDCSSTCSSDDEEILVETINDAYRAMAERLYPYQIEWKFEETKQKRKGVMQQLTARLKRALNKDLQAIYKMGWINGDLEITSEGSNALLELLLDLYEKELGEKAKEQIKELEKKDK